MSSRQSDVAARLAPEQIVEAVKRLPLGEQFEVLNRLVEHLEHGECVDRATLVEAVREYDDQLVPFVCMSVAPNCVPAMRCELALGHEGAHRADGAWWLR